jgi:RNA-directed DNA polymerase
LQRALVEGRSAVNTVALWPSYANSQARVLHVQTKLHKWAVADQQKKFRDLFNLVYDLGTLRVAWERVRANRGSRSAGVDGATCSYIEEHIGVEPFLRGIRSCLKDGSYRPQPVRERAIPKKGGKVRRLGIPTVTDRVVQMALKLVLEPIFEPDQYKGSYAYRPGRRAQDAVAEIVHFINNGYTWVVEGDIAGCFDNIRHDVVVERIRRRITDRRVMDLCKEFLKAGVLTELGGIERRLTGTPQGGVISPLFANLALSALDEPFGEYWAATSKYRRQRNYLRSKGLATYRLIRYSDDFVIMVHGNRAQAEDLRTMTAELLAGQGLTLSVEKTHITHVADGFDFLGFRIQRRPLEGKTSCAYTFMSKANFEAVKRKVKALTRRDHLNLPLGKLLMAINPILRGVANYFQHAAVKHTLHYLGYYTWWRVMRWLRAKHSKANWKWFKDRYWGKDKIAVAGVVLFRPDSVQVTRYRYRGARISTPWNAELLNG